MAKRENSPDLGVEDEEVDANEELFNHYDEMFIKYNQFGKLL